MLVSFVLLLVYLTMFVKFPNGLKTFKLFIMWLKDASVRQVMVEA